MMRLIFFCLIFIFSLSSHALQKDPYVFTSTEDAERFQLLTKETRCLVCQNQSIADSYAPLAQDLRQKIYGMVLAKKSDDEIKTYLTKRYGNYILLMPRWNRATYLLWSFPLLGLGILFIAFRRFFKNSATINHQ